MWLGADLASASARCDEVCSRAEVHRGLLRKQVIYVPYNAIAEVLGDALTLTVGERHGPGWVQRPKWLHGERAVPAPPRMATAMSRDATL